MTSALSPTQLGYIRRDCQRSVLYLAIHKPATVFSCRVNQAFSTDASKDKVVAVTYDSVTAGAYTDVIPGMTCYIGSTPGAWDLGMVRMRKAPTSSVLYPGENSDAKWADDAYLTVVDEFGLWAKYPRLLANGTVYMDYDVAYTNQHSATKPVVVMGSHAVLWLTGVDVSIQFDAGNSWCFAAGSKTYAWTATGGTVTGGTTATPTFTFDAAGTYRVACTVTVGGVSSTGYRYVFVYDSAHPPVSGSADGSSGFVLSSAPTADQERGGWEFEVQLFGDSAGIDAVRDGAMVMLFSRDWYGDDEVYIGAQSTRANIKCMGWIAGENLACNPVEGTASFSVKGPHYFLDKLASFVDGIESTPGTPAAWTQINGLTFDKAAWHLLEWRSTVTAVLDVYRSGDTHGALSLQTAQGGLLSQIRANGDPVFVQPRCDRYGRLFLEVEAQLVSPDDRAAIPVVYTLTKKDWTGELHISRNTMPRESRIELSGVYYQDGIAPMAYFALAAGHVFKRHGDAISVERLLLASQSEANERAGLLLGWHNRTYDFEVQLASNNCMVDIAPRQYIGLNIAEADTPRGVAYAGNMIPRRVTMNFDSRAGFLSQSFSGDQESVAENSVNGDVPAAAVDGTWDTTTPPQPDFPALPALSGLTYPSATTQPSNQPKVVVVWSDNFGVMYTKNFDADHPNWLFMNSGLSPSQRVDIRNLVVTPSGVLYLITGVGLEVMRAPAIGAPWSEVLSNAAFPEAGCRIFGIGASPMEDDFVMVFGGRGWSWPYDGNMGMQYMKPIKNGVVMASSTGINIHGVPGEVVFAGGGWSVYSAGITGILGSNPAPILTRHSYLGGLLSYTYSGFGSGPFERFACPVGTSGVVYMWDAFIPDSGYEKWTATTPLVVAASIAIHNRLAMAFSPVGQKAMAGSGTLYTPYKTTDGGATWVSLGGTIPAGQSVWENCRDDFRWIFGGGANMNLTMDHGSTYSNKQGDMVTLAPAININGVRFIS